MAWHLSWTSRALRDLAALDAADRERILRKLLEARQDPSRFFQRLQGSRLYRLRAGDHRVVAFLIVNDTTIEVRGIGHRSTVYDR